MKRRRMVSVNPPRRFEVLFSLVSLLLHSSFSEAFAPCHCGSNTAAPLLNDERASCVSPRRHISLRMATADSKDDGSNPDTPTFYSPNVPLGSRRTDTITTDEEESRSTSTNEYSFFDEATILVRAGSGGQGAGTFIKKVGGQNGPPDGGNGGRGGNVVLIVDPTLNTLAGLTDAWRPNSFGGSGAATSTVSRPRSFRAENGIDGDRQNRNGRFGIDVVIRVVRIE
jgi:hypothetical protein